MIHIKCYVCNTVFPINKRCCPHCEYPTIQIPGIMECPICGGSGCTIDKPEAECIPTKRGWYVVLLNTLIKKYPVLVFANDRKSAFWAAFNITESQCIFTNDNEHTAEVEFVRYQPYGNVWDIFKEILSYSQEC